MTAWAQTSHELKGVEFSVVQRFTVSICTAYTVPHPGHDAYLFGNKKSITERQHVMRRHVNLTVAPEQKLKKF